MAGHILWLFSVVIYKNIFSIGFRDLKIMGKKEKKGKIEKKRIIPPLQSTVKSRDK